MSSNFLPIPCSTLVEFSRDREFNYELFHHVKQLQPDVLEDSFSEKQKIPGELPYKTLATPLDQRHLFVS